eukprot:scaffold17497_cov96-Isochrysis_galbana.AAC.7
MASAVGSPFAAASSASTPAPSWRCSAGPRARLGAPRAACIGGSGRFVAYFRSISWIICWNRFCGRIIASENPRLAGAVPEALGSSGGGSVGGCHHTSPLSGSSVCSRRQ